VARIVHCFVVFCVIVGENLDFVLLSSLLCALNVVCVCVCRHVVLSSRFYAFCVEEVIMSVFVNCLVKRATVER